MNAYAGSTLPSICAQLSDVRLAYANGPAVLNGLNWSLQPGQVVGLLGRNGAGKTTLLETLLGLREPDAGRVSLFGQDVQRLDDAARARIGYVPQRSDLFEGYTPAQMLAYFRSFYAKWNDARVQGLMSRWDIRPDQPIRLLSGGQKQRLSIIRALAHEPDLLVLDEPVSSLDPLGRRDFLRELLDGVMVRGCTVVFSTHILSDLERVAFNVAFLSGGRIQLQAPLDDLLETVRAFSGSAEETATLLLRLGARTLKTTPLPAGRVKVLARLPALTESDAGEPVNLEELFAELT